MLQPVQQPSSSLERLESYNPRTGEKLGEVPVASPADVRAAVARARRALAEFETLRAEGNDVPILILSARTLAEDRTRGFDAGAIAADDLDLEDDLNYDDKWKAFGRLIIDMPSFIPNIYLMYTPMKWDETGSKDVNFNFGGKEFQADVDFDSELKLNHFDVALFWGLPFINTATADVLNIDLGLNVRLMDVKAEIEQIKGQTKSFKKEQVFEGLLSCY